MGVSTRPSLGEAVMAVTTGEARPLGSMLERFGAFHHMDEGDLAGFLGLGVDKLPLLREEILPEERAPEFASEVERIAARTGASAARLMQLARIVKLLR